MTSGSLIVTSGKNLIWKRLFDGTNTYSIASQFRVGTGTTTAQESDTNLTTPVGSAYNYSSGYPTYDTINGRVSIRGLIPAADLAGNTISESGLFNTDTSAVLVNHDVFTGIAKTTSKQIVMTWTLKAENVS